ncbi:helix-turn-helix domain-containing protein [Kribbella sp. NPDC004138]
MFESLGLRPEVVALYRLLLQQPELARASRLTDLARQLELPQVEVESRLAELRQFGFLAFRWDDSGEEYPLDPAVTFEHLAARRQQDITKLNKDLENDRAAAGQFTSDYRQFLIKKSNPDVEIFDGSEQAYQRMQAFRPQKFVWGLVPPGPMPAVSRESFSDKALLESGVQVRYVMSESMMKTRPIRDLIGYIIELGGEVRIARSIPFKLVIFDGESAVMGIDPDDTSVGAVVHHSVAVVRLAIELHQYYWDHARKPFEIEPVALDAPTGQELEFLRLLVQGATDEQVARKLGVSMRTVRRIAAKLSEQVGASGRFELGVRAAQRGWVN